MCKASKLTKNETGGRGGGLQHKDPAVNSTKGWRDFNKQEIRIIKDDAMRKPQQARPGSRNPTSAREPPVTHTPRKVATVEHRSVPGSHPNLTTMVAKEVFPN